MLKTSKTTFTMFLTSFHVPVGARFFIYYRWDSLLPQSIPSWKSVGIFSKISASGGSFANKFISHCVSIFWILSGEILQNDTLFDPRKTSNHFEEYPHYTTQIKESQTLESSDGHALLSAVFILCVSRLSNLKNVLVTPMLLLRSLHNNYDLAAPPLGGFLFP